MKRHLLVFAAVLLLLPGAASSAFADSSRAPAREAVLQQRLQAMRDAVENLKEVGQTDLAAELARRAEAVERELQELRQPLREAERRDTNNGNLARQETQWRAQVVGMLGDLREQVQRLERQVAELREQFERQRIREEDARFGQVDLYGRWLMTLPAGFKRDVTISRQPDGLYEVDAAGNLAGLYRHRGRRLLVEAPRYERLTEFVWEFEDENLLVLTEAPPTAKIGSDYRGAVLRRLPRETSEGGRVKPAKGVSKGVRSKADSDG